MSAREFLLLSWLLFAWPDANATSEIYRCIAYGGTVTYQQFPCPPASGEGTIALPSSYPEINRVERERLLQREAALDARLLKRLELEAAERIAREERASRERIARIHAEAERDRASETPALLVIRPMRRSYPRPGRTAFDRPYPRAQ